MAKKFKTPEAPKSTAQQLGSIVKSCRDIMRKDKGLNGDIDRLLTAGYALRDVAFDKAGVQ